MATTEQRTGFRLPWSSDAPPAAPNGAAPEREPFDADAELAADPALATTDLEPRSEPATATTEAPTDAAEDAVTTDAAVTDTRHAWPAEDAAADDPVAAGAAEDPEPHATADDTVADAAGPSAPDVAKEPTETPAAATPGRRGNVLVTGLVRAMREAAAAARAEADARFAETAKARIGEIEKLGAEETTQLRAAADADVAAIREWSKQELARIREETEERIATRKRHLELEMEDHAAQLSARVEAVRQAVANFEADVDAFFERLLAEEDPARVAGMAESLPEPPDLSGIETPRTAQPAGLDDADAAEAEALAFADLASVDGDGEAADPNLFSDGSEGGEGEQVDDASVASRLAMFAAQWGEPAAESTVTSSVAVTGLVSVASIAGFKRAIGRVAGVEGVTVASGPAGDFIFTVQHTTKVDLRSAVESLDGFDARITGEDDGVLAVSASDPNPQR